jgi:hypothetical protein
VKRETIDSGDNIMHSEDRVESVQMDLEYGGPFGSVLANKTTPTCLVHTKCPIGVTLEDVTKVIELLQLKKTFQSFCKSKIKFLKLDYVVGLNKLLGTKYNMEDMKKIVEEAQVELAKAKHTLSKA